DLEGGADQGLGALDAFVHLDHFGHRRGLGRGGDRGRGGGLVFGFHDVVAGDLLVDLDCHGFASLNGWRAVGVGRIAAQILRVTRQRVGKCPARREAGPGDAAISLDRRLFWRRSCVPSWRSVCCWQWTSWPSWRRPSCWRTLPPSLARPF